MDKWVGADRAALIKAMGQPHVTVPAADGGEVWTYIETYAGKGPANTTVSRSFTIGRDGRVVSWKRA